MGNVPLLAPLHRIGPAELGAVDIHGVVANPARPTVFVIVELSEHRGEAPCPECGASVGGRGTVIARSSTRRCTLAALPPALVIAPMVVATVLVLSPTPLERRQAASGEPAAPKP